MQKSAEQNDLSAHPAIMERAANIGQIEQVVSSADCRSAAQNPTTKGRVSEENVAGGAAGIAPTVHRSAERAT